MSGEPQACLPTAAEFFDTFTAEVRKRWTDKGLVQAYLSHADWTDKVRGLLKHLGTSSFRYPAITEARERSITHEYYRIDQCWFSYLSTVPERTWNLDVAIEYENKLDEYRYEVRKLLNLRCPLRVVIGYPKTLADVDPLGPGQPQREILEAWFKASRNKPSDDQGRYEYLLMLGKQAADRQPPRWRGYVLSSEDPWKVEFDTGNSGP